MGSPRAASLAALRSSESVAGLRGPSYAGRVDEALLKFYVEYLLECIATGVSSLPPAKFQALIVAMLNDPELR
jgi:hypothetical protein